jgi:tetratricopeptide (TPR) repeat protein
MKVSQEQNPTNNQSSVVSASRYQAAPQSAQDFNIHSIDYAAEQEVSDQSLKAWRLAVDHKGDESLKIIDALDSKYPKMKTVAFMKGQILERLGRKEEAIKWYQSSVTGNEFDLMNVFKLAEIQRQTGKNKEAVENYHKLLAGTPNFKPAQIGLAKACLKIDSHSNEAKHLLQSILESDPELTDPASREAKMLLQNLPTPKTNS